MKKKPDDKLNWENNLIERIEASTLCVAIAVLPTVTLLDSSVNALQFTLTLVTIIGKMLLITAVTIGIISVPVIVVFVVIPIVSTLAMVVFSPIVFRVISILKLHNLRLNYLPEDYVAELVVLRQRMEKQLVPPWKIRLRLLEEFLCLIWACYFQIPIENLMLPSDSSGDRQVDE